jgi:hypothetical protein
VVDVTVVAIDVAIPRQKQPVEIVPETDSFSKERVYSFVLVDSLESLIPTDVKYVIQGASLVRAALPIALDVLT